MEGADGKARGHALVVVVWLFLVSIMWARVRWE